MGPGEPTQPIYPRTYEVERHARRFMHGVGIFLVVFFLGLTPIHLLHLIKNPIPPLSMAVIDVLVIALAVLLSVRAERRVVLREDSIELTGRLGTRKLTRGEILGRRMGKIAKRYGGGSYYIIVPADGNKPELKLPPFLHVDRCFFDWMKTIPEVKRMTQRGGGP